MRQVYVETSVRMAYPVGVAVWSFDPDLWGTCVQGETVDEALAAWSQRHGPATVAETIDGDEQAFARDARPADDREVALTLAALDRQRRRARTVLASLPAAVLDHDDPARGLPTWAGWRTIRRTLWHICDTESRYYLPRTGLPLRRRTPLLSDELVASHRHVRARVRDLPRELVARQRGEVWTSTKLLRRLAWHERGELDAVDALLTGWKDSGRGPVPPERR